MWREGSGHKSSAKWLGDIPTPDTGDISTHTRTSHCFSPILLSRGPFIPPFSTHARTRHPGYLEVPKKAGETCQQAVIRQDLRRHVCQMRLSHRLPAAGN